MLSLTDKQLDQVTRAAGMLPTADRDAFLRSVAAQLTQRPPNDSDLAAAISLVLGGRGVSVGSAMFMHEPQRSRQCSPSTIRTRRSANAAR
jgi:hypothetical protein